MRSVGMQEKLVKRKVIKVAVLHTGEYLPTSRTSVTNEEDEGSQKSEYKFSGDASVSFELNELVYLRPISLVIPLKKRQQDQ